MILSENEVSYLLKYCVREKDGWEKRLSRSVSHSAIRERDRAISNISGLEALILKLTDEGS